MIIRPYSDGKPDSTEPHAAKPVRRRRWRWMGYVAAFGVIFYAGAYAKWKNWDWIIANRLKTASAAIPGFPNQIEDYAASVAAERQLPVVSLDVKFKHLRSLRKQREAALRNGYLRRGVDDDVPAQLTAEGKSVKVQLRLKGGRLAHVYTDKWSLRVKVRGEERPFGMRTFSLQHPMTRFYLNEWGFLDNLRREGIPAVRYQFVRLFLNGEDKGIYALEEHFTKELLESQGRRPGVIVTFDERGERRGEVPERDRNWWLLAARKRGWDWDDWDITTRLSAWQVQDIRVFEKNRIERDSLLSAQRDEAIEQLRAFQEGRRPASEVFDPKLMGRYMALVDLWRAWHAILWQNSRYYFNPLTGYLEPIGFDAMPLWGDQDVALVASRLDDRSVNGPLRDPVIARAYLHELARVSDPAYLDELRAAQEPAFEQWQLALRREFQSDPDCRIGSDLAPPWEKLAQRQAYIREAIHTDNMVIASGVSQQSEEGGRRSVVGYRIDLRNITVLPVEVVGFRFGNEPIVPASSLWSDHRGLGVWRNHDGSIGITPSGLEEMRFSPSAKDRLILASFFVSASTLPAEWLPGEPGSIEVATRFPGQEEYRWSDVYVRPPRSARGSRPVEPAIEAVLDEHGFLERTDDGGLRVLSGTWDVAGDLVVPEGVTLDVEPGTTLQFEPGAILYTTAAVQVRGTSDQPVVLEPQAESWGGLVVRGAEEQSVWEHATVRGTTGIERGGWMLTGGVTFHRSDATLKGVRFVGAESEDALNVVHAHVDLQECTFSDCASDAFDGDFVSGSVDRCRFAGIGGDAVDVSGSTVEVVGLRARDVVDKVVSAGESSTVTIRDLEAKKVGIAIAGKDQSSVEVVGAVIREAGVGLACYCKKPMFGPARITARQIELHDTERETIVQTGSSILLNGTEQPTESMDVPAFYADAEAKR